MKNISIYNRIRVTSIIILFTVLFYMSVNQSFSTANVSFIHLAHIIVQPFVFAGTIAPIDAMSYVTFGLLIIDASIFTLNIVAISRCFDSSTATCLDTLYEKSILAVIALIISLCDLVATTQFMNVKKTVQRTSKIASRVLNIFMLLFDAVTLIITIPLALQNAIFWVSILALFVDPICLLITLDREALRIMYYVVLGIHIVTAILTLDDYLRVLLSIVFITADLIQLSNISKLRKKRSD